MLSAFFSKLSKIPKAGDEMATTEHLLDAFPPVSTADWEAAIARDLRGADYDKKLVWRPEEGLAVKPYYRAEDLKNIACLDSLPGEFPYRRGSRASGDWAIREEVDAAEISAANQAALAAIAAGADSIAFTAVGIRNAFDVEGLLANLSTVSIHLQSVDVSTLRLLNDCLKKSRPREALLSTSCDAIANLASAAGIVAAAPERFVPFTVHAVRFEEAGATVVEELGLSLAAGVNFLAVLQEAGVDPGRAARAIEFSFAIGANYFFQIAKFRAFRMAWARVSESFGIAPEASRARIVARTSRWNKTLYDPHINILRATTEAMSAILGGADAISVAAFDEGYRAPDEASRRLARNTQLLLKHEAWLGRVSDPGGGSYYLEAITDHLAREAWELMQRIESCGGFLKARSDGMIDRLLERSSAARDESVARRRRVFIGTNQFANPAERALERADERRMKTTQRATHAYEQLRLRTERDKEVRPRILLAEIGDSKMRAARSNFALNFFACAGFAITSKRFKKAEEIACAEADLIVLCSADEEYAGHVAELMPSLKASHRVTPVVIAGNPANAEELRAAGVADFVHVRSNPLELLKKWQEHFGVRD
jgi:methylmalonyl-CoA mutase